MTYTKRVICLAASRKKGQHCFAGKDTFSNEWNRPVTNHGEHEVSTAEGTTTEGKLASIGDILDITFLKHDPFHFQHENHLIDSASRWTNVGRATYAELEALVDEPPSLWDEGSSSWGNQNNRVPEQSANAQNHSLWLIRPTTLSVSVEVKGGSFSDANKRIVKGHFTYAGTEYTMQVTDPIIEARMLSGADRTEAIGEAILCVSLGGAFNGYAYKLIAAVIEPY